MAGGLAYHLIDRRSRIQERRVAILQPVVGVADIPAHLKFDVGVDRAQISYLKDGRRLWRATYCVDPTWMKLTQSICALQLEDEPGGWHAAANTRAPNTTATLTVIA